MLLLLSAAWAQSVSLPQRRFPVQEKISIEVVIQAGDAGFSAGDVLLIDEPILHGVRWSKWGWLTHGPPSKCSPLVVGGDQSSVGRVSAKGPGGQDLQVMHSVDGPEIHEEGQILVTIEQPLGSGESVQVFLGGEGDCGWQSPPRAYEQIPLRVSYWPVDASQATLIAAPLVAFDAREQVERALVSVTSQAQVGEQVWVRVAPVDALGNLAQGQEVALIPYTFEQPGVQRAAVEFEGQSLLSNPVRVSEEPPEWGVFWGDLHTHHGHSYEEQDGSWVDQNHDYAQQVAGLDFGCETVKARPQELDGDALWESVQRSCREYSVEGEYLALLGFEWMGGPSGEGHHNVYYEGCDGPYADMDMPGVADGLWPFMEQTMAETGQRMVSVPHAPSFTGYNWKVADDTLRPVAEVFSEWGNSMEPERAGSVPEGLSLGQRLGFIASSDNHDGWLGNAAARKNTQGGLVAILAPALRPGDLLEGLLSRSTYATTGERILLEFVAWEGETPHTMGTAFESDEARFEWQVYGTAAIERVRLVVAGVGAQETGQEWARWEPGELDASGQAIVPYGERELAVWLEVTQVDQEMAWSSPIWLERRELAPSGCSGGVVGLLGVLAGLGLGGGLARRRERDP